MFLNPYTDPVIILSAYSCPDIHRRVRESRIVPLAIGMPQVLLSQDDQVLKDDCLVAGNFIAEVSQSSSPTFICQTLESGLNLAQENN